jgi:glycosyltransferase involved in cell wall biosynthesis
MPSAEPLLSVVIAAKDPPPDQLRLCLASFAALPSAPALQIVVVGSGSVPKMPRDIADRFWEFCVLSVPARGIYAAYNSGIEAARGTYVLFFGVDDIALPGMQAVFDTLARQPGEFHLYAAACYMQSVGIARPSKRRWSLAIRNWCHQGVFYLRSYLAEHPYQVEYPAQADHKLNIDIVSDPQRRIGVSDDVVAYFSAGGLSSMKPDLTFRRDFPAIVARAYGRPLGALVRLKQILLDTVLGKPEQRFKARTGRSARQQPPDQRK